MIRHAALYELCGLYYLYVAGKTMNIILPAYIESFLPILEEHAIDCLWMIPGSDFSKNISWNDFAKVDRDRCTVFPEKADPRNPPAFIRVRKKAVRKGEYEKDRFFAFPEHMQWSAAEKGKWFVPDAAILMSTIDYISHELGLDCLWGPGNLGMKILKRIFIKKNIHIDNTVITKDMAHMLEHNVDRPIWKKWEGLDAEQAKMGYLHCYDKNSQYLGAAQSVFLGSGQPEYVDASQFRMDKIGFWKYRITDVGDSQFNGYGLPCPLSVDKLWASTDLLLAARRFNVEFEILGGLVWPRAHKYLEEWAKEMRLHRVNLRDNTEKYAVESARENAIGTAKQAANSLMGRLGAPGREGSKELYKPDWNIAIVHRAITNQIYSFNRIDRDFGIRPILVSTDNWWIVSNEPDPAKAIPGILDNEKEQKGYKYQGTVEMTDKIVDMFRTERADVINAYLKKEVALHVQPV